MDEKNRDYKHEYKLRRKRLKRLHADIDRDKVEKLKEINTKQDRTYREWLEAQIDKELLNWPLFMLDELNRDSTK